MGFNYTACGAECRVLVCSVAEFRAETVELKGHNPSVIPVHILKVLKAHCCAKYQYSGLECSKTQAKVMVIKESLCQPPSGVRAHEVVKSAICEFPKIDDPLPWPPVL